ncbi:MAG: HPr family phosphocarrier protein [Deltaproteobacteria bacterium]|nr:HPr family phosphocarrier protein [Deltaproteobacteria bacterium]
MERTLTIANKLGLHARAAAKLVQLSQQYRADLFIRHNGEEVDGKSILNLLTLACPWGSEILVRTEGAQAEALLMAVATLIADKFGED